MNFYCPDDPYIEITVEDDKASEYIRVRAFDHTNNYTACVVILRKKGRIQSARLNLIARCIVMRGLLATKANGEPND